MEILPISPSSIPAREANPLTAKPKELIKPEKENFSQGHEETKLTKHETRKELPTDGPNAQSQKPDFPYSLVAGVTFHLSTPIAPNGASTDEHIGDVTSKGDSVSLDQATAFPNPIALGAPQGISIQLGRPDRKLHFGEPTLDADSMSAKWQKIGPNVDFAKLSPEFAAQSEKLSAAIKNFEVPGYAKEIDLSNLWNGSKPVQRKPEATLLPNAFPQPSIAPNNTSSTAVSLAGLQSLPGAPTSLAFDSAILSSGVGNFSIGADLTAADLIDPKKFNPIPLPVEEVPQLPSAGARPKKLAQTPLPVEEIPQLPSAGARPKKLAQTPLPVEEIPTVSNVAGQPKKLNPAPLPVEEIPTVISNGARPKKLKPTPLPVVELPQPKKLNPTPLPVEEIPTVSSVVGQPKKLDPTPLPVFETVRNQENIDSDNGIDWAQVETVESLGSTMSENPIIKAGSKDDWNWIADSADSVLNSLGLDTDAGHAAASVSTAKSEFGVTRAVDIREIKSDQHLPEVATKRLIEVIADRLEAIAAAKPKNGVTIQLRPLDLGSITMIVKNSGNEVGAELYASHDSVRQALDQNRAMLSQHLELKGMHLASVTVADSSLSNSTSAFAEQNAQRTLQQNSNQSSTVRFAETDPAMDPNQLLRKGKTDGIDYWI